MKICTMSISGFVMMSMMIMNACESSPAAMQEDKLLAVVYNKSLYMSDLKDMIPAELLVKDSSLVVNAFIEDWVREALLMHEAELHIPKDLNIDDLVRDYRSSLILHSYEKYLIEEELDSTISEVQLTSFYEANKEQYQLKNPIVRCNFIKIPLTAPDIDKFTQWWDSENATEDRILLEEYAYKNAELSMLEEQLWYDINDVIVHLPKGLVHKGNIDLHKNLQHQDDSHIYFMKIFEIVKNNEVPPMSYIENQAMKVILHKRKSALIDDKKEALYETELKRNNVKIYNQ